jgi:Flp pilus assembly protein TadG
MNKQTRGNSRNRKGERGSIMFMSAVGMLSLLLAVGLGVDISNLYLAKNELQNAADAAALAGASGLNFDDSGIHAAVHRIVDVALNKYQYNKQDVAFLSENVRFAKDLSDFDTGLDMSESAAASTAAVAATIRFVKVKTQLSPVGITFASTVLGNSLNLTAEAVAGMSAPLNLFAGYLPVSVVDDDFVSQITPGNLYTIRGGPQSSISPGNYQILAIDGSGAADDRTGLASAVKNVVGPGGHVDTKPGVTTGPVKQGINTRFDDYASGIDPNYYPPDLNIKEGITYQQYQDGSPTQAPGHEGIANRRIVLIPIVKKSQFDGGRTNVQIDHFGAFFLRTKVQGNGDIQAEYIGIGVVVGGGSYDPTAPGNPGPPIVKPVIYR